jgi:hypothetical protein
VTHDIRRKRPPVLSFLLRISTARRLARVLSLLALDFAGVALAIFTALVLKEAVNGHVSPDTAFHGTKQFIAFAYLLTALLFARSGLYSARALRRSLPDRGVALPGRLRRADLRGRQRRALPQLLPLLRLARLRTALRVLDPRGL